MTDVPQLPVCRLHDALVGAVTDGRPVVLTAPTGSGKSTQVPKMLLEALGHAGLRGKVIVLQPRRLAARMLAERVAAEMGVPCGGLVGFQTRYERVCGPDTRILFLTEGILTRMLIASPRLPEVAAVVFDEFHERSLNVDLGLAMARHCLGTLRPDLRLVVMSATLDAESLLAFLPGSVHLHAEGRAFPVDIRYLRTLGTQSLYAHASQALMDILNERLPGDILVFMPGGQEIRRAEEEFRHIRSTEPLTFLPLYGDLPPERQRAVMEPLPTRKVIIATNIAETSLTIPGVRHVIDSGLARVARFDAARGVDILETQKIARDSADQRAGRAGREAPGTCRRLWLELEQSHKPVRSVPEIDRIDLAEAVLAVCAYGFHDPRQFPWFETPAEKPLLDACRLLEQLGVLAPDWGGLTDLGRDIRVLPAHPRLALLLHQGARHGCFREAALAAALVSGRPLVTGSVSTHAQGTQRRQDARRRQRAEHLPQSDFLVLGDLLEQAADAHFQPDRCQAMGIHAGAARDAWRAFGDFLAAGRRLRWAVDESADGSAEAFLRCVLRAFPDRLARRRDQGTLLCDLAGGRRAELARDSVVRDETLFVAAEMRETDATGKPSPRLLLALCSGVREEWLWEDFPDQLVEGDEPVWDERAQAVRRRLSLTCLGITLDETLRQDPDPAVAAEMLASRLDEGKLTLPEWNEDVERWIARVLWLRDVMPDHPLPAFDDADKARIHRLLCEGETSYRAVKAKSCLDAIRRFMGPANVQFVERNAPAALMLPRGRRMRIDYVPGQTPRGRARIQDLYDMTQTVRIAGGRVAILMDILAPNNRTVQITADMESFWSVQYPKIRNQLARRYPKHEWR